MQLTLRIKIHRPLVHSSFPSSPSHRAQKEKQNRVLGAVGEKRTRRMRDQILPRPSSPSPGLLGPLPRSPCVLGSHREKLCFHGTPYESQVGMSPTRAFDVEKNHYCPPNTSRQLAQKEEHPLTSLHIGLSVISPLPLPVTHRPVLTCSGLFPRGP